MLKGIPPIVSPELMNVLMEMGHGDEIVLADANFPAASCARRLVRAAGHGAVELLDAVLRFLPLDDFVPQPVALMSVVRGDPTKPTVWEEYRAVIRRHEPGFTDFEFLERADFYERARRAFAVVATGERALYGNVLLKMGVVRAPA